MRIYSSTKASLVKPTATADRPAQAGILRQSPLGRGVPDEVGTGLTADAVVLFLFLMRLSCSITNVSVETLMLYF